MAKTPSIKSAQLDKYQNLNLHELEAKISELEHQKPNKTLETELRTVRYALRKRLRQIKTRVMEFEQTNDRYLLIYDSTNNFSKVAGRSVLFYALTIANRLHRRYSIKPDSDGYSVSSDGIISIRALAPLEAGLKNLNIYLDEELSDQELHFYKLPRVYTEEQINHLRSDAREDHARITNIIVPHSPIPLLYTSILELNQQIYHCSRRISDTLAREVTIKTLLEKSQELLTGYLEFANFSTLKPLMASAGHSDNSPSNKNPERSKLLFSLLVNCRSLRFAMANVENLRLISHHELGEILLKLVEIEKTTAREYQKLTRGNEPTA